jgi:hypothetical protein
MTWKTWAATLSLGAALTMAAAPTAQAFDRTDGSAGSAVIMEKNIDILDLYTWMEPTSGNRMYFVMTVNPQTDRTLDRFSSSNLYVFHTSARQNATDPNPDNEVNIICKFDSVAGTQGFECWAGANEYVKGKVNATGQSSRSGALTVFAGPRNDPFFMNNTGLTAGLAALQTAYTAAAKDAAGCPNIAAATSTTVRGAFNPAASMDTYRGQNVLAIVISIDPVILMPGAKKTLSVWASTNRAQ